MKTSTMKHRLIIQLIPRHAAAENSVQNTVLNRETNIQKNKTPAHHHGKMKRSTGGMYMFASQKNKPIEGIFPDGDVLHIEDINGLRRCIS